jgi:hypothetical protein
VTDGPGEEPAETDTARDGPDGTEVEAAAPGDEPAGPGGMDVEPAAPDVEPAGPGGMEVEPAGPGGMDVEPAAPDVEPAGPGGGPAGADRPRPSAPPTHVLARSAVAGVAVVLAVAGVVAALRGDLPAELLGLVADYFDRLFGLLG